MPTGGDSKGDDDNDLGEGAALGCTERCTDAGDTSAAAGAGAAGEHFAAALAMIATLPLTDTEKAEAVRRLLGGAAGGER